MTIDYVGNVGIGIVANQVPGYSVLEVKGPSEGGRLVVNYNNAVFGEIYVNSNNVCYIGTRTADPTAFIMGGLEKFRISG